MPHWSTKLSKLAIIASCCAALSGCALAQRLAQALFPGDSAPTPPNLTNTAPQQNQRMQIDPAYSFFNDAVATPTNMAGIQTALPPEGIQVAQAGTITLPQGQPFQLPTYQNKPKQASTVRGLKPLPNIDIDAVFNQIVACYPTISKWKPELNFTARAGRGTRDTTNDRIIDALNDRTQTSTHINGEADSEGTTTENSFVDTSTLTNTGIDQQSETSDWYVGVIFNMPIYSSSEQSRERDREYKRRTEVSSELARLTKAMVKRTYAERTFDIFSALEKRSQDRVTNGLADTAEQVGYLKDVHKAHNEIVESKNEIAASKLKLLANCRPEAWDSMRGYLDQVTR